MSESRVYKAPRYRAHLNSDANTMHSKVIGKILEKIYQIHSPPTTTTTTTATVEGNLLALELK